MNVKFYCPRCGKELEAIAEIRKVTANVEEYGELEVEFSVQEIRHYCGSDK